MGMNNALFAITLEYFDNYLPKMRKSSPKTITTYRKAMEQFLDYLKEQNDIRLYQVTIPMINRQSVSNYLDYVEDERKCSVSTRNHRLDCIRSFMKYAATRNMDAAAMWTEIQTIAHAREDKTPVEYLKVTSVEAIIAQPDASTRLGLRDKFLILFLYQTGMRVAELVSVRLCDIQLGASAVVTVYGKGSKVRKVPLREKLVEHLKKYLLMFHPDASMYSTECLFYTIHKNQHTKMTEDNVRRLIQKYGDLARKTDPSIPVNVHPHLFRHSIAMHLYQNGVPLTLISQWLGHSRLETTFIYAYADTEQKRKAIEKAIPEDSTLKEFLNAERYSEDDDDLIKRLYGLK